MAGPRRYKLLCPIARALDRVGDRWTLLILRDLHAGPARFSDLLAGLTGIASNLLTNRLNHLVEDGLVRKSEGPFGVALYELTELGTRTNGLLFELARFGGRLPLDEHPKPPGNLRTIAVTMKTALQRIIDPNIALTAELVVDGEPFSIIINEGRADVLAGPLAEADVRMTTSYEPLVAVGDGRLPLDQFIEKHCDVTAPDPVKIKQLGELFGAVVAELA